VYHGCPVAACFTFSKKSFAFGPVIEAAVICYTHNVIQQIQQRIKFNIHVMCYDVFYICQSLSEIHQSAGSACQEFITTSGSGRPAAPNIWLKNKNKVCRTCVLCHRSICVELSTRKSPTRD